MSSSALIISLTAFFAILLFVTVYLVVIWHKYHLRKKIEKYGSNIPKEEEEPRKRTVSLQLPFASSPPFSSGDVREVHVQPKVRRFSVPDRLRKYSETPPYHKYSNRERTRTISESTVSGPATPLGSLDPEMYLFEEIEDPFEKEAQTSSNLGRVQFIVEYDHHRRVLLVRLVRAVNLVIPPTTSLDFDGPDQPCNPYAIIQLLPDFENQLQSNVHRKTSDPRFDETFEFDIETKNLQEQSLWITLMSFDTFSKHDVSGQVVLPLREINSSKPNVFLKELTPSKKEVELGEILISLGYLKSAERLTLVIIKARNLPAVNIKGTDPYVKITLLQDGKRSKKKRTTTKKGDLNPTYNEAVSYDINADLLDSVDLLVSVMHGNDVIGSALIGSHATGTELKLWQRMHNSDRPLPHWSKLQDPKMYN